MSGEGVLPAAPGGSRKMVSVVAVAFGLEARANAIEAAVHDERVQPHTQRLPTESELAAAQFAARQLRVAADELRAGLIGTDETEEEAS